MSTSDSSQARQDLNEALMALNPDYEPLGFTINSLSSCSPGVMKDTLNATKAAMATILSTIGKKSNDVDEVQFLTHHLSAPGQESCLWTLIKSEMETFYQQENDQKSDIQVSTYL